MKKVILSLILLFGLMALQAQTQAEAYIKKYDSIAVNIMNTYGIPASIVLGIGLHESGAGTSKICKNYHNHFGVKGRNYNSQGKRVSSYRRFSSDEASYGYFAELISQKKYYPELRGNSDIKLWLRKIKSGGYASSPAWSAQTEAIINKYNLTRYDQPIINWLMPVNKASDSIMIAPDKGE